MDRNQTRCSRREGQTLLNKWEDKRQSLSVTMDTWHVVGLHGGQQGMRGGLLIGLEPARPRQIREQRGGRRGERKLSVVLLLDFMALEEKR